MRTKLLALGHDLIHDLIAEIALISIGSGPAAGAVHVAGIGRVKQDQPRNIAVVLFPVCTDHLGTAEKGLVAKVQEHHLRIVWVRLVHNPVDELHPAVVRILHRGTHLIQGLLLGAVSIELSSKIDQLHIGFCFILLRIQMLQKAVHHHTDCLSLCRMRKIFHHRSHLRSSIQINM